MNKEKSDRMASPKKLSRNPRKKKKKKKQPDATSGKYVIEMNSKLITVYCDMKTAGGWMDIVLCQ